MKFLQSAVSEIVGLFIDDWLFALLLIVWVVFFAFAGEQIPHGIASIAFFAGIAALVLAFVVWKARVR